MNNFLIKGLVIMLLGVALVLGGAYAIYRSFERAQEEMLAVAQAEDNDSTNRMVRESRMMTEKSLAQVDAAAWKQVAEKWKENAMGYKDLVTKMESDRNRLEEENRKVWFRLAYVVRGMGLTEYTFPELMTVTPGDCVEFDDRVPGKLTLKFSGIKK